jgi:antitoxin component YwqK of YwqJK toxin-antitoxin module
MRHFIFTILLVVPLLLTAQSKKEQIATLNLKVDSLFEVLVNNAQKLSDQRGEIFQLSQEKSDLEKSIVQISQEKLSLETEMSLKNSSLDTMQVQLQLAQDENSEMRSNLQDVNDEESLIVFPPSKFYTGIAKLYGEAGELQYEIPFKDGKKEGIEIAYNDYGDIAIRETPYKDGKKEGEEFEISGEGEYRIEYYTPYKDGKVEGVCITSDYYYMTRIETLIKDGEVESFIEYSDTNEVLSKVVYKDGEIEEGIMRSYLDDGHESYQIIRYKSGEIVSKKCMACCDENWEEYEIPCD